MYMSESLALTYLYLNLSLASLVPSYFGESDMLSTQVGITPAMELLTTINPELIAGDEPEGNPTVSAWLGLDE